MGTNLSVTNDRESSPDPWWQESRVSSSSSSANVRASLSLKSTDTSLEEKRHKEELALAVAAAVASTAGVPTTASLIYNKNEDQDEDQIQENLEDDENEMRHEENQKKLEIFKKELATKREARQKAIAALTDKLKQLQQQVKTEENARKTAELEVIRLKELLSEGGLKEELEKEKDKVKNLELELKNERRLRLELEKVKEDAEEKEQQIRSLKEVASIGKEMLRIRELQVNELKKKLCETQYPEDLREEYEAQIQHVRRLKTLYEERAEAVRLEHQKEIEREVARIQALETKISELENERKEAEVMREHLKDRVLKLDQELEDRNDAAMTLQEQLDASVIECRDLASQMSIINNLFSQMLVGDLNLDRISRLVEENQSLVIDLTSDDKKNDLAALLLDIAKQLDDDHPIVSSTEEQNTNEDPQTNSNSSNNNNGNITQQEVALNLSKVWRILVQLLTQDQGSSTPPASECDSENCYKSVETPSGKRSVISVSQTYLTLKNLILEKNALIKEVNKLKLLNGHLETRLGSQEKRLSTVSTELKKTWGVVSKLRVQHKQLHTQEKILKYELQHKRILLNDLKDELERCKEIWDMARKKNCQSEEEWRKLRKEFADRRKNTEINNSAESGYEDDESNTPPTEDSIDEQELDRLVDPENDAILLVNEELPEKNVNFINLISSDPDKDDKQNNSEDTTELLPTENIVSHENISGHEHKDQSTSQNNTEENQLSEPESHDDNSETLIDDKRSQSFGKQSSIDTTAENISRFLEGLFAPEDSPEDDKNIIPACADEVRVTDEETSGAAETIRTADPQENSNVGNTTCSWSQHSDVQSFELESTEKNLSNIESCSTTSFKEPCDTKIEISNEKLQTLKDETPMPPSATLEDESSTAGTQFENNHSVPECIIDDSDSSCIPIDSVCPTDELSGTLDEACGYTPTYFPAQVTSCVDLPSVHEVLGILTTVKEDPTTSYMLPNQTIKKPRDDNRTTEEVLDARTERLKRLEEQCKSLFNKVTATNIKSNVLSSKLELLHEQYGRSTEGFDEITSSTTNQKDDSDKNIEDKTEGNIR